MTRLVGKGLKFDVGALEIAAMDGVFKLSNSHAQFEKGRSTWKATVEESTMAYYLNNRNVMFLDILDSLQDSTLKFVGGATFHDVWMSDSALSHAIMTNLCRTDRTFSPLPIGVVDEALNAAAVEKCHEDMLSTKLSVSSIHEYMSKLLIAAASHHAASRASISQLHGTIANLSSTVSSSAEGKERDRVRAIMTEFEAVVDALRLEVSGKVKGMGASMDTLKSEWSQVGDRIESFNTSLANIVSFRLLPVEDGLVNHRTQVSEQHATFNSALSDLTHHVTIMQEQRIQQLNDTVVNLHAGQEAVQDKLRYRLSAVNASLQALAEDLVQTRDTLNKSLSSSALEIYVALRGEKADRDATAANVTAQFTTLCLSVGNVQEQSATLNESLAVLATTMKEQHNATDNMLHQLADQHASLQNELNSTVTGLQEQVMAEFGHTRREFGDAVSTLNESVSSVDIRLNTSIARLEASVLDGVSFARNNSEAYSDTQRDYVLHVVERNANASSDRHQQLEVTVANMSAQLRWELANVTESHWNATVASITELTTNTSHVVARSNSILARAIGEVNSSMLLITETLQQHVDEVAAKGHVNLSMALTEARDVTDDKIGALKASTLADQATMRSELNDAMTLQGETLNGLISHVDERLNASSIKLFTSLTAHNILVDSNMQELRSGLTRGLDEMSAVFAERYENISVHVKAVHLELGAAQGLSESAIRSDLSTAVEQLNASFALDLRRVDEDFSSKLSALAVSTEEHSTSSSDKLRYQLTALNNTAVRHREEDQLQLQLNLAAINATHSHLEQRFTNTSHNLQLQVVDLQAQSGGALRDLNSTLLANLSSVEAHLNEKIQHTAKAAGEQFQTVHQRVDSVNASLSVNVSNLSTKLGESHQLLQTAISAVKTLFMAADEEILHSTEKALKDQLLQLQSATTEKVGAVTANASTALNAAISALQTELNASIHRVAAHAANNHSSVEAALLQVNASSTADRKALSEQIVKTRADLQASIELNSANTNASFVQRSTEFASLSRLLTATAGTLNERISTESTKLVADIDAVKVSLLSANTSWGKRMDASDAALSELSLSSTARFAVQSSDLAKHAAASNATISATATKAQQLHDTLSNEVSKNVATLNATLSRAIQSSEERTSAALDARALTIISRVEEVHIQLLRDQNQQHANLSSSIAAVQSELGKEHEASIAARSAIVNDLGVFKLTQEKVNNFTAAKLESLSVDVGQLRADLTKQASTLSSSLSNFTAQQKEAQDGLLVIVNERVRQAEVQQQLGAVAVEAVRNDTQRLSQTVAGASARVAAVELDSTTVRSDVRHLQEHSKVYAAYYSNFTSSVLPALHSQLGALQQESAHLGAQYKQVVAEVRTFKDETTERLSAFSNNQVAASNVVHARLQTLTETSAAQDEAIKFIQARYIDSAVQANTTSAQLRTLDVAVAATSIRVDDVSAQLSTVTDTQRQVSSTETKLSELSNIVRSLQQASTAEAKAVRESADKQAMQIAALEDTVQRQRAELQQLQEENRRLLRESATAGSVDELRKLLFDLQGQMLAHSSKVLDLLLQPRSAVLVHNPCDKAAARACTDPAASTEAS